MVTVIIISVLASVFFQFSNHYHKFEIKLKIILRKFENNNYIPKISKYLFEKKIENSFVHF